MQASEGLFSHITDKIPNLPTKYLDNIKNIYTFFDEIEKVLNNGGRFNKKTLKTIIIRIERLCNELDMKLDIKDKYMNFPYASSENPVVFVKYWDSKTNVYNFDSFYANHLIKVV